MGSISCSCYDCGTLYGIILIFGNSAQRLVAGTMYGMTLVFGDLACLSDSGYTLRCDLCAASERVRFLDVGVHSVAHGSTPLGWRH